MLNGQGTSTLTGLDFKIEMLQLCSSLLGREMPLDRFLVLVTLDFPSRDFPLELFH